MIELDIKLISISIDFGSVDPKSKIKIMEPNERIEVIELDIKLISTGTGKGVITVFCIFC